MPPLDLFLETKGKVLRKPPDFSPDVESHVVLEEVDLGLEIAVDVEGEELGELAEDELDLVQGDREGAKEVDFREEGGLDIGIQQAGGGGVDRDGMGTEEV